MDLKKVNEINETSGPLFFLVLCALVLGIRLGSLIEDLDQFSGSIVLSKPPVIPDDGISAFIIIFYWLFLILTFLSAFARRSVLLIFAYFFVSVGLILEPALINKIGYKALHGVEIFSLFLAVILLSKYLTDKIDFYKSNASPKTTNSSDNEVISRERRRAR